jgi:hypothetical protein
MTNKTLIIPYILVTLTVVLYLAIGWFSPGAFENKSFHSFIYGMLFFVGWLILIVAGVMGFIYFKNSLLKVYCVLSFVTGLLWLIATINQMWYKI